MHTSIVSSFLDAHLKLMDNATKKQENIKTFHPSTINYQLALIILVNNRKKKT
jgi:hypothetical protein